MSIVAYVGLPGSGKSYGVVENVVIPALKADRHIVTNIPLKKGYLSDDIGTGKITIFDPREPLNDKEFWKGDKYSGAIWIIDECQRYWPSGMKASQIPEDEFAFFTEHRHYVGEDGLTNEVVLVTQNLDQVANCVRSLVEETYRAKKLSALGLSKMYQVQVFDGCQKGLQGGEPVRTLEGKYKQDIFKYYKSHTKNKTDFAAGMEQKADKRNNVFKGKLFTVGLPIAVALIYFGINNLLSYLGVDDDEKPVDVEQQHQAPSDVQSRQYVNPANVARAPKAKPTTAQQQQMLLEMDITREYLPLSETWRIVGQIGKKLMLWSERGERTISKHMCGKFDNTKEDFCVYNGEMVTWYSSVPPVQDENEREYDTPSVEDIF